MFETIKNAFGTKEIRVKIWATLLLLLVYRIGCFVPVPGLNVSVISQALEQSSAASFLNVISAITAGRFHKVRFLLSESSRLSIVSS